MQKKIKIYREINKITQSDLAEKTKIPVATIKKYELSTRSPRHVPLKKIADALNVSANVFLDVEAETIGDICALFFLLSKSTDLKIHGKMKNGKYSADDVSFSFSNPILQKMFAEWADSFENTRSMRNAAKTITDKEARKTLMESAEKLERNLEYGKVKCKEKI